MPEKHLLRAIDRFVDLDGVRITVLQRDGSALSRAANSHADRWLLHGHPLRTAAVRRGSPEPGVSLVLPVGANGTVSEHPTFSENRHDRFRQTDVLRRLFETVVQRYIDAGLVGGEDFAVDSSSI